MTDLDRYNAPYLTLHEVIRAGTARSMRLTSGVLSPSRTSTMSVSGRGLDPLQFESARKYHAALKVRLRGA